MAYDEGLAEILRDDLTDLSGVTEKKMFGGLCFLLNGNMLCGVHKGGAMFRVGKDNEAAAMAMDGAGPMEFTGRKMGGMIDVTDESLANDTSRAEWLRLSLDFVKPMPAK